MRLEFTNLYCFGIFFLACISLDYYTTNNTFNDIVINNLNKLYHITCACSCIQYYIFSIKTIILFLKKPYLVLQLWFWCIQTWSKFCLIIHKNNKSHHKCTKITCVFEQTNFILIPHSTAKIQMLKHTNKNLNMIFIKKNSSFTNPSSL